MATLQPKVWINRRRFVLGDANRRIVSFHDRSGTLGPSYKIVYPNGGAYQFARRPIYVYEDGWDANYHGSFRLPAVPNSMPSGPAMIDVGRGPEISITISNPKTPVPGVMTPGNLASDHLDAVVRSGANVVTFASGTYYFDKPVALPGITLLADNCTFRRTPKVNYGTNWPLFVLTGPDPSLIGATIVYDDDCVDTNGNPNGMIFYSDPPVSGLCVRDCRLKRCALGFYGTESYIADTEFHGGSAQPAPYGLWHRVRFYGRYFRDPFALGPLGTPSPSFQMVDAEFEATSRGPVHGGDGIEGAMYLGVRVHGVSVVPNGQEIFLAESGPVNRSLFLHTRVQDCFGSIFQWDMGGTQNLIKDLQSSGGYGINWWSKLADTYDNDVDSFEITGGGILLDEHTHHNRFTNGFVSGFQPTRGGQSYRNAAPDCDARRAAILARGPDAATNTFQNVSSVCHGPDIVPMAGASAVP